MKISKCGIIASLLLGMYFSSILITFRTKLEIQKEFTVIQEEVIVAQPPMEPINYLDYLNEWIHVFNMSLVKFETQTLELNQQPQLYADADTMKEYSDVINEIMSLTTELIAYPIEAGSEYQAAQTYFKKSAVAYRQAMSSMWDVATFYQLDVNSDIINESFEKSINNLKDGMTLFQKGASSLQ